MIKDFGYKVPGPVSPAAKIKIKNSDDTVHTVTANDGKSFDVTVPAGKTVTFTAPSEAGTYAFSCNFHSNMHGRLVVR